MSEGREQEGPTRVCKHICNGCKFFSAEWWKDYLDNDETDCGWLTSCNAVLHNGAGRHIRTYGSDTTEPTPPWCPYLSNNELVD